MTLAKKQDSVTYNYDISCDYVALDAIADRFKGLLVNINAGNLVSSAGTNVKTGSNWQRKDEFVKVFRDTGLLINAEIEKLEKLADRMKRVAETMRDADATVNISV